MNFLLESVGQKEIEINDLLSSRTELYSLEPMGLGTPYIESLTSYISRLAINHNVHVSTLINELMGQYIKESFLAGRLPKGLIQNSRFNLVNGIGTINKEFVEVLETLTGRNDIQHMSFRNWEGIFSTNIITKNRRWCPACIEQWKKESKEIYEPLIWGVTNVEKCDIHEIKLKERCPNCKKELTFVHRNLIVGYCQYCCEWLGESEPTIKKDSLSDAELFISEYYKQLLRFGPSVTSFPSKNFISLLLPEIKKSLEFSKVVEFAHFLNVRYNTLLDWMSNRHIPNPEMLLSICEKLDITIYDLFLVSNGHIEDHKIFNRVTSNTEKASKEKIHKHLLKELSKDTPRSLGQVCKELGITPDKARNNFPTLCKEINDNYALYSSNLTLQKQKRIEKILKDSFCKDIPQSLNKILDENGITYKDARRNQLVLCRKISARYKEYIRLEKNKRIDGLKAQIKSAICELNNEGIYPTVAKIAEKLPSKNPNIFRQKVYNDFRKSILLNLGYKV